MSAAPRESKPDRTKDQAEPTQSMLRALADPQRYEILKLVAKCSLDTPCSAVRECVTVAPPTLSHHMKELQSAGLIDGHRDGRTIRYSLRRDQVEALLTRLAADLLPQDR